jgi:hypothetical protein
MFRFSTPSYMNNTYVNGTNYVKPYEDYVTICEADMLYLAKGDSRFDVKWKCGEVSAFELQSNGNLKETSEGVVKIWKLM